MATVGKRVMKNLIPKVEPYGFHPAFLKDKTPSTFLFEKIDGNFLYGQRFRFTKSHYVAFDSTLNVYNQKFSDLILKIDPFAKVYRFNKGGESLEEVADFTIMEFRLEHYTAPENREAIKNGFQWSGMCTNNTKIWRDGKVLDEDIEPTANAVFSEYFVPVIETIIPRINSLDKIDSIVNDVPGLLDENINIDTIILSPFSPVAHRYLVGIVLANYFDRKDKERLTARYEEILRMYPNDMYGYVPLSIKAIEYFYGKKSLIDSK